MLCFNQEGVAGLKAPRRRLGRWPDSENGAILPLAVFGMVAILGCMGLALDFGNFYRHRRIMQTAADAGALAGGAEIYRRYTTTASQDAAILASSQAATASHGFANGSGGVTVTVSRPPTSGYYVGNSQYVQVAISQNVPSYFLGVLASGTTTIAANAVAGVGARGGPSCLTLLEPTGAALTMSGTDQINAPCGTYINSISPSGVTMSGSAQVNSPTSIRGPSYVHSGSSSISNPTFNAVPVPDPLAYLQPPTVPAGCNYTNFSRSGNTVATLNPGTYCGGITLSGSPVITLNPGLYIFKGGSAFTISGFPTITGSGVTFYLTNNGSGAAASVSLSGTGTYRFSAPTSGPLAGILYFQDPSTSSNSYALSGSSGSYFDGAIYLPQSSLAISGSTQTWNYSGGIIARSMTISGSTRINLYYGMGAGTGVTPIKRLSLVE
ncbi:MAG: hypothetical protein JMDDDDMK_01634 [Acidobacteria bacterium]|nr:hypothetical protein [Acidobacteriota bacterium]